MEDIAPAETREKTAEVGSASGIADAGPLDSLPDQLTTEEAAADLMPSQQSGKVSYRLVHFFCPVSCSILNVVCLCATLLVSSR